MGFFQRFMKQKSGNSTEGASDPVEITNRAYYCVERGEVDDAITLLKKAIQIDPKYGHAYNELAFVYGKIKKDLSIAEEYAMLAFECEPENEKFLGTINGIMLARAKSVKSEEELKKQTLLIIEKIQKIIELQPELPSPYNMKAVAFALIGKPKDKWEAELDKAEQLYKKHKVGAAGAPIDMQTIDIIMKRQQNECVNAAELFDNISKFGGNRS